MVKLIHTYVRIDTRTHTHTYVRTDTRTHTHTNTQIDIYAYNTSIQIDIYAYKKRDRFSIHNGVCVFMHANVHIYIDAHT